MQPYLEEWTLVVAGSWNTAIFAPEWVAGQLLQIPEGDNLMVELIVKHGRFNPKYSSDQVSVTVTPAHLLIATSTSGDDAVRHMEQVAARALDILKQTPVTAVGVNFGFEGTELPDSVTSLFGLEDSGQLIDRGYVIENTDLIRRLRFEDRTLNLRISCDDSDNYHLHFNFHAQVASADEARERIDGRVIELRDRAYNMLETVYHIDQGVLVNV